MHTTAPTRELATAHRRWSRSSIRAIVAGAVVLVTLGVLRATAPEELDEFLPAIARDFLTLSISVVLESLPFVFLGLFLSIAVQLWVPMRIMTRVLSRNPFARRAMISVLGILLPVCECGNVPLSRGLMQRGLSVSDSMTFLVAAPILNPVTIITTYQAFGWGDGILVWRILGGVPDRESRGLGVQWRCSSGEPTHPKFSDHL